MTSKIPVRLSAVRTAILVGKLSCGHPWLLSGTLISILIATAFSLTIPLAARGSHGLRVGTLETIDNVFLTLSIVAIGISTATALRVYFINRLGDAVTSDLRRQIFSRLLAQPLDFHQSQPSAELISRLSTDIDHLRLAIGASFSMTIRNVILLAGAIAMLLITNVELALLTLVTTPLASVPIAIGSRFLRSSAREYNDLLAESRVIASEALGQIRTVKEFAREAFEMDRHSSSLVRSMEGAGRRTKWQALLTALSMTLVLLGVTAVLWAGTKRVSSGQLSAGELGQFVMYAVICAASATALLDAWGTLQRSTGAIDRAVALCELPQHEHPESPWMPAPRGRIRFDNVEFWYLSAPDRPILKKFSLDIAEGEKVALIGASGAGKSTVLALLMRLYPARGGSISIDGYDIAKFNSGSVRDAITVVPQAPAIFGRSVSENIRYGRLAATEDDVRLAAVAAGADTFIREMPLEYDEPLGEHGARLSGGQQQRVAIARALLKHSRVLLLDEPTSGLDSHAEKVVQDTVFRAGSRQTVLVVAHRLHTILAADRIIVMDQGTIIADGTHHQLLSYCPYYRDLVNHQALTLSGQAPA